jgi:hypothetical protein
MQFLRSSFSDSNFLMRFFSFSVSPWPESTSFLQLPSQASTFGTSPFQNHNVHCNAESKYSFLPVNHHQNPERSKRHVIPLLPQFPLLGTTCTLSLRIIQIEIVLLISYPKLCRPFNSSESLTGTASVPPLTLAWFESKALPHPPGPLTSI